jgi:hypothetical protein
MSSSLPPDKKPRPSRSDREAQALRENLRKRKSQQRGRLLTSSREMDYKNEDPILKKEK